MKAIVAVNNLGYIGKDGGMMWRCSEDLKHFKTLTDGCTCLAGRKTFESLPPLKNRELVGVGKRSEKHYPLHIALQNFDIDWIIGGAEIYRQTLHLCSELHISHINNSDIGDVKFPKIYTFNGGIFHYYFEPNP